MKNRLKKIWKPSLLVLSPAIIIYPWIVKSELYQCIMISSDTRIHADIVNIYATGGEPTRILYPAQIVFGFILGKLQPIVHISALQLFSYFMLVSYIGAGVTIYYVFSKLLDKKTGWFALGLGIFCANGTMFLFRYGVIYNLIDMYIVLLWAIYFSVKWLVNRKWSYLLLASILWVVFSSLHLVGIYVLYIGYIMMNVLLVYSLFTKRTVLRYIGFTILVLNLGIGGSFFFMSGQMDKLNSGVVWYANNMVVATTTVANNIGDYIRIYFINMSMLIGGLALWYMIKNRAWRLLYDLKLEVKSLLFITGVISVSLIGGGILGFGSHPDRLLLDGLVFGALFIAIVVGQLWNAKDIYWLKTLAPVAILASVAVRIIEWVR